jgi:signal transduction histidine kinase
MHHRGAFSAPTAALLAAIAVVPTAHAHASIVDRFLSSDAALITGIVGLLILQTALIVVLMLQNHRQRQAQNDTKRQQSEVAHAARLVLVGEITASIAHEVNQPLSAILSNADAAEMLLSATPPPLDEIRQILDDIRRDDLRAHGIVRNLRKLLTKREVQMESVDLNEIAQTVLLLTKADAARRGIMVTTTFDDDLPRVQGDPVHLQQVLLNLIVNAMDSMTEVPADDRRLEIATRRRDARSIEVSVTDSGAGVKASELSRLFDSFYTTKPQGMGLGLSIARAIVQTHGGNIWAQSNGARGAAFTFTIPMAA